MAHQVVAPGVGLGGAAGVGNPQLRVAVRRQHGDVGHDACHPVVHVVQQQVTARHAVRLPEEPPRHVGRNDHAGQGALEVGLRERFPVQEAELEDAPEVGVHLPHVGRQLLAGGQGDAHLLHVGIEGDGLRRGERLETFAARLHGHAAVHAAIGRALGTGRHVGDVERAAAVHFGSTVGRPRPEGDDYHHNHADGQRRAQQGDPRDDGVLAEVVEGLEEVLSKHIGW